MSANNPIKAPKGRPKRTHSQTLEDRSAQPSTSPPRVRTRPNPSSSNPISAGGPLAANASSSFTPGHTGVPSSSGPANPNSPWARVLENCSKVVGRLGAKAEDVVGCLGVHENVLAAKRDCAALQTDLEELLATLSTHFSGDLPPIMTATMDNLCTAISKELNRIREKESRGAGKRHLEAKKDLDDVVECYRRVYEHMKRLTLNADLSTWRIVDEQATENRLNRLMPSMSACYDSAEAALVHRRECTPETRKQVLVQLSYWRHDRQQPSLYWMNGMAGTGKTTIANSLCVMLDHSYELGASFFCTRQLPECRNVKFVLPTIAYQLARFSRPFRCALSRALERDPDLHTKVLAKQFEGLFANPLREVMHTLPVDLVVVIDAVDECDDSAGVGQLLEILAKNAAELPLKVFISSRPEPQIRLKLDGIGSQLTLHELEKSIVKGDIETYLRVELEGMLLSGEQLAALVECAGVLFIYAATVVRYIGEGYFSLNPKQRLANVLGTQTPGQSKKDRWIDQLYSLILSSVFDNAKFEEWDRDQIKHVLHTVVCAQEPLTVNALASLLQWDIDLIHNALRPLWSVLHVSSSTNLVNTLHASFPDYMLDPARSKQYVCDPKKQHRELSKLCFRRIEGNQRQFNICELESSHLPDDQVPGLKDRVLRAVPPDLLYACQYWATHMEFSEWSEECVKLLKFFLSTRLLLWMEVLNLTSRMRIGAISLEKSRLWCEASECGPSLRELVHDAWRFVTIFATNSISRSTPHIYVSMLASWSVSRPLAAHYYRRVSGRIEFQGFGMEDRQLALLNTHATGSRVGSIAISPDSNFIAFSSYGSIYVWDVKGGRVTLGPLQTRNKYVCSIAFSSNGTRIASGSVDSTVCIWNALNGELVRSPLNQTSPVFSVAFSPDGLGLASGYEDGSIALWEVEIEERAFELPGAHTARVDSVSFSPDGRCVVSGSHDETIRVWDAKTLAMHIQLNTRQYLGHIGQVCSVSFSPDSTCIVFCTQKGDICVWNTLNDEVSLGPLQDEGSIAQVVAFSPDGKHIASGNANGSITVRDAIKGGRILGSLEGHKGWVTSIAFSPDFTRIASGSDDCTMRIWDVCYRDEAIKSPKEQPSPILSIAVSPNGEHIAAGCEDSTICVWSLTSGRLACPPLEEHAHRLAVTSVSFSHDSLLIVSGCRGGMISLRDARSGEMLSSFGRSEAPISSVAFSPDSKHVVSSSWDDHSIRVWDVQCEGNIPEALQGHTGGVWCLAFPVGGMHLVSGSDDTTVRIWDMHNGQQVSDPLQGHTDIVTSVACSPNGKNIVSSSDDYTACLWDAQSQQLLHRFTGHTDVVGSVAFSPDGTYVASASFDRTIIVWNVKSGEMALRPLKGHTDYVNSVVFSFDGTNVISGSQDGTIRIWSVSPRKSTPETPPPASSFHSSGHLALLDQNKSPKNAHSSWFLDDGWVIDREGRLLVWIPPDLHSRLLMPENTMLLARHGSVRLNFENANIGALWKDCYVPAEPRLVSPDFHVF